MPRSRSSTRSRGSRGSRGSRASRHVKLVTECSEVSIPNQQFADETDMMYDIRPSLETFPTFCYKDEIALLKDGAIVRGKDGYKRKISPDGRLHVDASYTTFPKGYDPHSPISEAELTSRGFRDKKGRIHYRLELVDSSRATSSVSNATKKAMGSSEVVKNRTSIRGGNSTFVNANDRASLEQFDMPATPYLREMVLASQRNELDSDRESCVRTASGASAREKRHKPGKDSDNSSSEKKKNKKNKVLHSAETPSMKSNRVRVGNKYDPGYINFWSYPNGKAVELESSNNWKVQLKKTAKCTSLWVFTQGTQEETSSRN